MIHDQYFPSFACIFFPFSFRSRTSASQSPRILLTPDLREEITSNCPPRKSCINPDQIHVVSPAACAWVRSGTVVPTLRRMRPPQAEPRRWSSFDLPSYQNRSSVACPALPSRYGGREHNGNIKFNGGRSNLTLSSRGRANLLVCINRSNTRLL